ncbi:tyrosine-protein kinase [soil metagenome]
MRAPGSLSHLLYPLRKRWYLVMICIAVSCIIATRYLYMVTPVYQANATLKIEDPQQGVANSNLYRDFDVFKTNTKVQTEVEVLKSRSLFEKALERLDFFVEYYKESEMRKEEVYHDTPFTVDFRISDSSFYMQDYAFKYEEGNKFKIVYKVNGTEIEKAGVFGKEMCDRGVCITLHKNEGILRYKSNQYLEQPWSFAVYSKSALSNKMMNRDYLVKAVDKDVNIIKVYYSHPIQEKAVLLVNAVAKAYIDLGIEDKQDIAGNTVDFINQQLAIVSAELEAARDALKTYRIKNGIVNLQQETETTYKTLGQLEVQKIDINMQLSVLENLSDYLRKNKEITLTGPEYGTVVDELFTEGVSKLNSRIREKEELLRKFTAENDRVKSATADIGQMQTYLIESVNNTRRKLLTKQDELYFAIEEEKGSFNGVPEKESTMQELTRNYYLYEKVYSFLIEKRTEAIIARQVNVSFNKVLEAATLPLEAVSPRGQMVWGVALFLGLVIGIAFAFLRHYLKPSVNAPEDFDMESTIPVIGQIVKLKKNEPAYQTFTALSTRILMNQPAGKKMVITITSTRSGEGKSFIATNLARTLAAMDKKVLLIDLNTHKPTLGEWFDARGTEGIKEVYTKHISIQDVIQLTSIPNLDLVTCGEDESPIGHLLATQKTKDMLDELRTQYDAVIIDTPEAGEYTDAVPFMKWSDLNLYVVRAEGGGTELVANAEMVKEEYRLSEVYFVLNAMKEKRNHTGYIKPAKQKTATGKRSTPQLSNLFVW